MRLLFTAAAIVAVFAWPVLPLQAASTAPTAVAVTTQLPRTVRPDHYDLSITPDAAGARFTAQVGIDIDVLQPTASITLNAVDLSFTRVSISAASSNTDSAIGTVTIDAPNQTATLTFSRELVPGRYRLEADYSGVIGTQASGLFALDYVNGGTHRRALYTQFENADARRLLPSWDEPAYKASFTLSASVPVGQLAVSNMPVERMTAQPGGRQLVRFARTPVMSTYLLFFGMGDFERGSRNIDGTELGVITQRGALPQAQFALDSSAAVLREYNDYFGVRYPLPKLDNIAAPGRSEFFGAMENWGAIFSFERAILLDPRVATQNDRIRSFAIAAHEIAHQWFGDLVTMQWWDDLWLNEGFASWMESRTTARLHPEWHTALRAVGTREHAMERDSFATTHPVVQRVATVEQASQAFDAITYQKGESVIRMLESYVGADAWREGVRSYIKAHAYGNTVSDDLWGAVERAAGKPIRAIAHDFTLQPGIPLIGVSVECREHVTHVRLRQTEFSRDQPQRKSLRWQVPVTLALAGQEKPVRTLIANGQTDVTLPGCGAVLVNAGQSGYFRTLYDASALRQLSDRFSALAPLDQIGLLSDSWALGQAGRQPLADFLALTQAVPLNADPQVWQSIAGTFAEIHQYYQGNNQRRQPFDRFATSRLAPVLAQIGWVAASNEAEPVAPLRDTLIRVLSMLDEPGVIAEARRRYAAQANDSAALPAALRKVVFAVVAEHADAATWATLHSAARAEAVPLIRSDLFGDLAAVNDAALARQALALALTDEAAATDRAAMVTQVSHLHPELSFDFAMANRAQIARYVDPASSTRYFARLASTSSEPAMLTKLAQYAVAELAPSSRQEVDTAMARIRDRIRFRAERLAEIDRWLVRHGGESSRNKPEIISSNVAPARAN